MINHKIKNLEKGIKNTKNSPVKLAKNDIYTLLQNYYILSNQNTNNLKKINQKRSISIGDLRDNYANQELKSQLVQQYLTEESLSGKTNDSKYCSKCLINDLKCLNNNHQCTHSLPINHDKEVISSPGVDSAIHSTPDTPRRITPLLSDHYFHHISKINLNDEAEVPIILNHNNRSTNSSAGCSSGSLSYVDLVSNLNKYLNRSSTSGDLISKKTRNNRSFDNNISLRYNIDNGVSGTSSIISHESGICSSFSDNLYIINEMYKNYNNREDVSNFVKRGKLFWIQDVNGSLYV